MFRDLSYEELEQVFNHFPNYNTKIMLGDFNIQWTRYYIFKPTIGNERMHQSSSDNGVRILNLLLN